MTAHPRNTTGYPTWTPAQDAGFFTPPAVPPDALLGAVLPPAQRDSAHRTSTPTTVSWPGLRPLDVTTPANMDVADASATPPTVGLRIFPMAEEVLSSSGTWPLEMLGPPAPATPTAEDPQQATTPKPPRTGHRSWFHLVGYPITIAAGIAIGMVPQFLPGTAPQTPRAAAQSAAPSTAPQRKAPANPAAGTLKKSFSDGTFVVGKDIRPGHYVTAAGNGTLACYWARLKNTDGDLGSIIANDNIRGRTTVTIHASDGAFQASGGCTWVRR